ncbi:MAG: DUF192 domain-containing protein [Chlamydiia bacterium]|nr:DUF192 domain-containing protein [Chlamydiia bacterium]
MLLAMLFALLPMKTLLLGPEKIQVEIADTEMSRAKGLMERDHLLPGTGMLFIFPESSPLSFWMKNTKIPLSIAFFDEKEVLFQITDMPVPKAEGPFPRFKSIKPAKFALEVPQGWFQEHQISIGMKFSFLNNHPIESQSLSKVEF